VITEKATSHFKLRFNKPRWRKKRLPRNLKDQIKQPK
jgi:hypothetical protein